MISIVIPCYEMHGRGLEMLRELIDSISYQTFKDYEIVISNDNLPLPNTDNLPFQVSYAQVLRTKCVKGKPGAAANLNNAIDHAQGDIIKPMFQDDKFIKPDTLQRIANAFMVGAKWVACDSQNAGAETMRSDLFKPYPHRGIFELSEGENTYGSPSAMAWAKTDLRFDENLSWLFDCEFYGRMAHDYGVPRFIDSPIYIRQWEGMATETVANGYQRILDHNYVVEKFRAEGMNV